MNDDELRLVNDVEKRVRALPPVRYRLDALNDGTARVIGGLWEVCGPSPICIAEFVLHAKSVGELVDLVRKQDKRARHAEQERDTFAARIRELEAENKTLVDLEKSSSENAIRNAALAADRAGKIKILEAQVASLGSSSGKDKP